MPAQVRNLPNYWSGSWRGRFTVTLGAARKATLAGSLSVRTHYFENGNVQVRMGKGEGVGGVGGWGEGGGGDALRLAVGTTLRVASCSVCGPHLPPPPSAPLPAPSFPPSAQTHDEKALSPVALDFSDGAALGTAVVAAVAAAEGALVVALDDVYETMSSSVLKVRRGRGGWCGRESACPHGVHACRRCGASCPSRARR